VSPPAPALVVQHQPDVPLGRLGDALAAAGLPADVRGPGAGAPLPTGLDGHAALIVLGGSMGAGDEAAFPHLAAVKALLREARARERPALGICLGAQLAAAALGGAARRGEHGWEIGWLRLRPTAAGRDDPVTGVLGGGAPVLVWHQDTFTPPPEARRLLSGGVYEQAFRLGSVWALQPHPEVDPATLRAWCEHADGPRQLASAGVRAQDMLGPAARLAGPGRALLDAWCAEALRRRACGR
jgi:GMP synthase (glutamine-hydrolysing)